ncbi:H-NS histone family protein [Phaeobacter sp. LSS9]|uniref:Regulatory protein, H-NS histone family n=1 Tax=Phaeobacter piscinae TaxID=1580596 RepID=A0AAN1GNI1_9RHOB|nr:MULTISPECIES: H-NS histone family protein [Phaeobacter]ATG42261.1 putative regulatory protein, H-NS histone family [Phaeobacter piscinae]AUQ75576.1 putative regulatory protein, H-NS histone family [Phaeobacter piscinae]AUR34595.1 putative regulatory protein, H-NS histone family [Phaeobacter piscinae]AXT36136.1 H-NS histone family protein [Phaeobacter sp. LSS9]
MAVDLTSMSRKELLELQSNVEKALKDAEQRERIEALKAAEEAAAKFGFSLDEIAGNGRSTAKKTKAAPKYRNPQNPEETWTGRGRKPHWVHAALTSGVDISDLEI